jgi:hypothetical protein
MDFHIAEAIQILERTPASISALLAGLSDPWLHASEGPGTFSPIDVLGHLILSEQTDWIPRAKIILESGESRPFDPFDRFGFQPIIEGRAVGELLVQFATLREQNLTELRGISPDLDLTGTHPGLGRVTMRQLIAAWAVHDLGHIAQITRVLAKQYRDAVGPWHQYLSIVS